MNKRQNINLGLILGMIGFILLLVANIILVKTNPIHGGKPLPQGQHYALVFSCVLGLILLISGIGVCAKSQGRTTAWSGTALLGLVGFSLIPLIVLFVLAYLGSMKTGKDSGLENDG